jgi:predicted dehydrogenase
MSSSNPRSSLHALRRPLRLGVIGGGPGSFIGPVHMSAAVLDRYFVITAGVLSSHAERAQAQGMALGLPASRAYASVDHMLAGEAARPEDERIEAVAVMTPNDRHYVDCMAALQAGLHVICDKPMVNTIVQARELVEMVERTQRVFCLTHNYTGYPMVRQARAMVESGLLGDVRIVQAEYFQAGMALPVESGELTAKLRWKLDPGRSGASLVMGDIGTHAHHLATYVTGSRVARVSADVGAVMPGRTFDDYAAILWRFENGARGSCMVTQAAAGAENNIRVRVHGAKGMLEWQHSNPNYLVHAPLGESVQMLGRGDARLHPAAQRATRIARGHPEGFRESFANLYADFAEAIAARITGIPADPLCSWSPNVHDGLWGLEFVEATLASSRQSGAWITCHAAA